MPSKLALQFDARLDRMYDLAEHLFVGKLTPAGAGGKFTPAWEVPDWPTPGREVRPLPKFVRRAALVVASAVLVPHTWALASSLLGAPTRPTMSPSVTTNPYPATDIPR
jgi:hypothetical protein